MNVSVQIPALEPQNVLTKKAVSHVIVRTGMKEMELKVARKRVEELRILVLL